MGFILATYLAEVAVFCWIEPTYVFFFFSNTRCFTIPKALKGSRGICACQRGTVPANTQGSERGNYAKPFW